MINSRILLNRLMIKKQLVSNRQVAAFLGISHMTVNRIVNGGVFSDDVACEIAKELGLDVDFTLLAIVAERSKNDRVVDALRKLEQNQKEAS